MLRQTLHTPQHLEATIDPHDVSTVHRLTTSHPDCINGIWAQASIHCAFAIQESYDNEGERHLGSINVTHGHYIVVVCTVRALLLPVAISAPL